MPQQVRRVVSRNKGESVSVDTILVPHPGPGEAVASVQACGECHTDLLYREGGSPTSSRSYSVTMPPGSSSSRRRSHRLRLATTSSLTDVHPRHAVSGRPGRHGTVVLSFGTIIESIRDKLLTLPGDTTVHTGHGDFTTIGAEAPTSRSGSPADIDVLPSLASHQPSEGIAWR
jgi:hypothetical protein